MSAELNRPIIGSGGDEPDSGPQRVAVEDPDSLQSHQYAKVLDLISEGEIGGLVNGLQSVYLNDVPAMAADGSMNVSGVTFAMRNGSNNQSVIEGFSDTENEISVGTEVKHGIPKVVHVSGNVDSARVTLGFPRLTQQDTATGDLHGTTVQMSTFLQNNGGGYQPVTCETAWFSAPVVEGQVVADNASGVGMTVVFSLSGSSSNYSRDIGEESGGDGGDVASDGSYGSQLS